MCSKGGYFDCHRFSMISIALEQDGFEVKQFFASKEETQRSLRSVKYFIKKYILF
jgi:hypothetical protein